MIRLITKLKSAILLLLFTYTQIAIAQDVNKGKEDSKGGPVVIASAAPQNICSGEQSTLTASGSLGTPPYSYNWDNGLGAGDTHTVTPVVNTTYTVTITDNTGLSSTDQITITVFSLPVSGLNANPNPVCNGNTSTLDANPSGGTSPYGYNWNAGLSGNQTHIVNPTTSTTYLLTITDANGCTITDNVTLTVNQNPTPTASATPDNVCSGGTTTLAATATGGTGPYSYNWNGGLGNGVSHVINPTMDVTYTVTVSDANGCTGADQVSVNVYDLPAVTASAFPTSICAMESGTLSANGLNGTGPYSYNWDNGLGAGQNQVINPADTTTYSVTVTDANGCTGSDNITVDVWELPNPAASASPDVICENTSTNLSVSSTNGVSPYSYSWSDGLGVGADHTVFPTSDETYTVTAADANGCTATGQVTVTVNSLPGLTTSASPNPVCSGETVTIDATGSGTTVPYSYFWNNGLGTGQSHLVNPVTSTTYNVTVTDGNGCTNTGAVNVTTSENPSPTPVASPNPICPGASSTLSVTSTNGLAPYTYIWDNGLGSGDTHNVTPASPTTYTVTATDAAGCTASASILLDFSELPGINLSASPNPLCEGSSSTITTNLTGGNPPFMFAWDNGLGNGQNPTVNPLTTTTYTVTVTDNNGCTSDESLTVIVGSSPTVTANANPGAICPGQTSNLSATGSNGTPPYSFTWDNGLGNGANHTVSPAITTTYSVTITDTNGCTTEDQITVTILDAPVISADALPNPICALEITNLSATATGGTPGYSFTWDHGLGAGAIHTITPSVNDTYGVTVSDANGCEDTGSVFVQVVELPSVTAEGVPNPVCQGENVTLNAIGNMGSSPYSYIWNQGLGVGETHTVAPATSTSYTVTISDANGCTAEDAVNVTIWDVPVISASASPNPICSGDVSTISATAGGSTPPYTYFWDNGIGLGASHIVSPAGSTNYTVLVSDGNGCTANSSVSLIVTNMPPATPTASPNPVCPGENVTLSVTGTGGTAPYSYTWDNGLGSGQSHIVIPPATTTYSVTVEDATGCTTSGSITVGIYDNPSSNLVASPNPICETGSTTLEPNPTGGLAPYTFTWDNGLPSIENPTVTPSANTTYNLTITDSNGCSTTDQVNVTLEPAPSVTASGSPNPICEGQITTLDAVGSGGTPGYNFTWDNGLGTGASVNDTPSATTMYHVTISDINGCSAVDSTEVVVNENPGLNLTASPQVICEGSGSTLTAWTSGGIPPYSYAWTPTLGNSDTHTVNPGTSELYSVSVTDANNCTAEDDIIITVNETPAVSLNAAPNPICYNTGTNLTTTVTGGTPAYSYTWDHSLPDQPSHTVTLTANDTYNVTVTDINSCSGTDAISINVNPEIVITVSALSEPDCTGNSNASFTINVSGGNANYDISWTNGTDNGTFPGSTGGPHLVNGVTAGNYQVNVTDASSCTESYNFVIDEPAQLSLNPDNVNDISCNGQNDGSLDYTISGGTANYTINWDNGSDSGNIPGLTAGSYSLSSLGAGTYNISLTDNNGCITTDAFTLNEPSPLTFSSSVTSNVSCLNGNDGVITAGIGGGTPDYSISWDNGTLNGTLNGLSSGSHQITSLAAGNYTLILTDAEGCTGTLSETIIEPSTELEIDILSVTNASCVGVNDGAAEIDVTGGIPPYIIVWDHPNGSGTQITNVTAGDYHVTVTDDWGCERDTTISIGQPDDGLSAAPDITPVSCASNNDGSITLNTSGGTSPYNYIWDPAISTGETASNLSAGDYDVTISDAGTCVLMLTINVPVDPNTLTAAITDTTHVSCFGGNDGEIVVTATNGNTPYSYAWDGYSETGNTLSNIPAGAYEMTVTDNLGCEIILTQTINEPPALNITEDSIHHVLCVGDLTGDIYTTPSGGTPPYSYIWEDEGGNDLSVNANNITGLPAGTYYLSLSDNNGCPPATASFVIYEPANALSVTINIDSLPSCPGLFDGGLTASASGGIGPYSYLWDTPVAGNTNQVQTNLGANTYSVTVTDAGLCTAEQSIVLNDPPALIINTIVEGVLCYGEANGEAIAQVSGGTPNYTYLWEDALSNVISLDDTASNLAAGNYFLTVSDANSCNAVTSVTINEPDELTAGITHTNVSTWGNNDGSATANPSDGTPGYSYEWENDANPGIIIDTEATADNLYAGTYNVTITDDNGCQWSGSVTITEPDDPLGGNITLHQDVACAPDSSGNLSAEGFGGTAPYNYAWQNASGTLSSNTQDFFGLPAGSYFLTITDDLSYTWDTTVIISQPPALEITATYQLDIACYGDSTGQASLDVTGGTPGYSYNWQGFATTNDTLFNIPNGTYFVTVTDNNGCEADTVIKINTADSIQMNFGITAMPLCNGGSEGSLFVEMTGGTPAFNYNWEDASANPVSTTDTVTGLPAGMYYLTVNDINGCIQTDSVFLSEPDILTVSLNGVDATGYGAPDALAWAVGEGGTTPYSYNWEDVTDPGVILSTDDSLENVTAGTYSVTLTDVNGCTVDSQITLNEPDELIHTIIGSNVHCYGDSTGGAWIQATGGVLPYTYSWTDNTGTEIWTDSVMLFIPAGEYFVTVTDANGYTTNDSITIIQPPALYFGIDSIQNVLCYGDNSAYIDLNPNGGTPPYLMEWTETGSPATVLDTDDFIQNIYAGEYMLSIVDDSTCVYDTIVNIIQPDSLGVILETQGDITCYGYNNGFINIEVLGGTPPYSYLWQDSTGATIATGTDSIGNLAQGEYSIFVSDANSCFTDTLTFLINEPLPFTFSAVVDSIYCYGESTGSILLNPTGGTPSYNYTWLYEGDVIPDSNFAALFNLEAGNYEIIVTDNNLCDYDTTLSILQPSSPPGISLTLTDSLDCYGQSDAEITVQVNGGTPDYNLNWTNGAGTNGELTGIADGIYLVTGIAGGTYTFTLEDHYACSDIENIVVPDPAPVNIDLFESHILCYGEDDGILQAIVSGGTPPYLYSWDGAAAGTDTAAINLTPGWHNLLITDGHGCTLADSSIIYQPDSLMVSLADTLPLSCHGDSDASILAGVTGGTIPFSIVWTNESGDTIQTGAYISGLDGGVYYLDVSDANGCSVSDSVIVTEPNPLSADMESFLTQCPSSADGYAVIHMDPGAGTSPYTYDWNNPEHSVTDTAINLNAGWWYVTVHDANNCVYLDSVEIFSPDSLNMNFTVTPVQCNDVPGSVVISTNGGTPSYTYAWSTSDSTGIVPDIPAGIHTVTVTDSHSCTWAEQVIVESVGNIHPEITVTSPISCYGNKDGELTAILSDGALPFVFDWNTGDDTQSIDELFAGTYFVEVTDNWGCVGYDTLTLIQPDGITIDFITRDVLCRNGNSGWAQAIAGGGNGGFSYAWNASFYGNPYTNLSEGFYTVIATDQEGCSGMETVYIDEPDSAIYALAEARDVTCYGYNNGRALAQGFGGQSPYEYLWYGPGNDSIHQQQTGATLFPGNYYLEVTDVNGCKYDTIVKIRQPGPIYVDVSGYGSPSCDGLEDGWIELDSITGGTPPYTIFINGAGISWTQQNPFIDSIPAGMYQISVYDVNQCLQNNDAVILTLAESEEECIRIPAAFSPNGDGFNDEWQIDHLDLYRRCLIQVYNRWGQLLYEGSWDDPFWDGTYNGNPVPTGAYIYYVNLGTNSRKPLTGTVTVIR